MTAVCSVRLLALSLIVAASSVHSAQPLVTDDAAVLPPKTCQFETWTHWMHDGREYWALPACNFTGNLELTLGGARAHTDDDSSSLVLLQAKTVLSPRTNDAWSFGAVAGTARDTGAPRGSSAFQIYYAKALASWYPRNDLEVDLNLGAANVYGLGTFALAGAAIQYTIVTNLQLLAEAFRDEPGRTKYQLGARYVVIPNRLEAYVSYGNRFPGSSEQWSVIVGVRVQTPPFLP